MKTSTILVLMRVLGLSREQAQALMERRYMLLKQEIAAPVFVPEPV